MRNRKSIIILLVVGIFITIFLFLHNDNKHYVFSSKATYLKVAERLTYKDYYNNRYKFSIKYPDNLIKGEESTNGDGITFTNENGNVKLIVFGSNNIFDTTAKSAYEDTLKEIKNVAYKKQSENWYVISWVKNNKIIYKKEVVGDGSINTLIFEYPLTEKKLYDEFLQNLDSYFKTPGIGEAH